MKLRRTVLGAIILLGVLLLVLGLTGVLSTEQAKPPAPSGDATTQIVSKSVELEGENWTLRAQEARVDEDGSMELIQPVITVHRTATTGEQQATITADTGRSGKDPQQGMHLRGHVRAEFKGEQQAVLTTQSLDVEPSAGTGRTSDPVEAVIDSEDGRQFIRGTGLEFALKPRAVTVAKDIRMELTGGSSGLFEKPAAANTAAAATTTTLPAKPADRAATTHVFAAGPCFADGFRRTVELQNDVLIRQEDGELRARRVEMQFAEGEHSPQRVVAEGDVRLKSADAEGTCDRLVRSSLEDRVSLEGNPANVKQQSSEIHATRIEFSAGKGGIFVPVEGNLVMAPKPGEEAQGPITVKWSRMLRFDPNEHRAQFRGDVHFTRGDQVIDCQLLSVRFDNENRELVECRAENDVRMTGRAEQKAGTGAEGKVAAQSKELTYNPRQDAVVLTGDASIQQEDQVVRGERIEVHQGDSSMKVTGKGRLEGKPGGKADTERYGVSWTGDMQYDPNAQSASFRRDVTLDSGTRTLSADSLLAKLGEGNKLEGFTAQGRVVVKQPVGTGTGVRTLKSDKLVTEIGPDNKMKSMDATGHASVDEPPGKDSAARLVTADRIVSKVDADNLQGFEAIGHATLLEGAAGDPNSRLLKAERFLAHMGADNQLQSFEARGRSVTVEEQGRTARGVRMTWNAPDDLAILYGSPAELREGPNRLFGDHIEFSRQVGTIKVVSAHRVQATVVSEKGLTGALLPETPKDVKPGPKSDTRK